MLRSIPGSELAVEVVARGSTFHRLWGGWGRRCGCHSLRTTVESLRYYQTRATVEVLYLFVAANVSDWRRNSSIRHALSDLVAHYFRLAPRTWNCLSGYALACSRRKFRVTCVELFK